MGIYFRLFSLILSLSLPPRCGINKCCTTYYCDTWIALFFSVFCRCYSLPLVRFPLCQFDIHHIKCARSLNVCLSIVRLVTSFSLSLMCMLVMYSKWFYIDMDFRINESPATIWFQPNNSNISSRLWRRQTIYSLSLSHLHSFHVIRIIHNILICWIHIGASQNKIKHIFFVVNVTMRHIVIGWKTKVNEYWIYWVSRLDTQINVSNIINIFVNLVNFISFAAALSNLFRDFDVKYGTVRPMDMCMQSLNKFCFVFFRLRQCFFRIEIVSNVWIQSVQF